MSANEAANGGIVLSEDLLKLVVNQLPHKQVRMHKRVAKSFDGFIEERRKAALDAEIKYRLYEDEIEQPRDKVLFDLLYEAVLDRYLWGAQQLLGMGRNAEWVRINKGSIMQKAVYESAPQMLKLLLANGVAVDAKDVLGRSIPLHLASRIGNIEMCRILIENGASLESTDSVGNRPLHLAALCGHPDVVQFLLERGAQLDSRSDYGRTALHRAAYNSHMDVARVLLAEAAKRGPEAKQCLLDARDEDGDTPLHDAYCTGTLEMAKLLEAEGADRTSINSGGDMPREMRR